MAAPNPENQWYESELAMRLLTALEAGSTTEIVQLQGEIIGLHYARLRLYVVSRLNGQPRTHAEEVFGEAAAKMFESLWKPEKVRWVTSAPGRSFGPLFGKIAKDEIANYGEGRRPYGEDKLPVYSLESELASPRNHVDCIEEHDDDLAAAQGAAAIIEAAGGLRSFDGLLLHLTAVEGIGINRIEQLLMLAQRDDRDAAEEAAALLDIEPVLAEQYLSLIRECPSASPLSYNALKVAVHRARKRVRKRIDRDDPEGLS